MDIYCLKLQYNSVIQSQRELYFELLKHLVNFHEIQLRVCPRYLHIANLTILVCALNMYCAAELCAESQLQVL
jgi:hypothetical protein